jgi:nitrate reductase gamma subunit
MGALQYFIYLSVVVMALGIMLKAIKIARMPIHLRWDLYPIPHEKGKGEYGGSYYEEINWWTKPANFSLFSELKEMAREIFLIQTLFHHNRPLWYFSFPFHLGLYLLIGFVFLLIIGAVWTLAGAAIPSLLATATIYLGAAGSAIGLLGALGLFLSRLIKSELRIFTSKADYFNLLLLAAIFAGLFFGWLAADRTFDILRGYLAALISFQPTPPVTSLLRATIFLTAFFFLYLPFTHMTHFVGKYFTYHKVRWEDHPNIKGGKIEAAVTKALGYKLNWAAPHIRPGTTWAQAATDITPVTGEEKK